MLNLDIGYIPLLSQPLKLIVIDLEIHFVNHPKLNALFGEKCSHKIASKIYQNPTPDLTAILENGCQSLHRPYFKWPTQLFILLQPWSRHVPNFMLLC